MIKIVIINHSFQKPEFYKRWKLLSDKHKDVDVTLLAPSEWTWGSEKNLTYGHSEDIKGNPVDGQRFRIHLIDMNKNRLGDWTSRKLEEELINIKPDMVYFIGVHLMLPITQLINIRKKYSSLQHMKILVFSMRGHQQTLSLAKNHGNLKKRVRGFIGYEYSKWKLNNFNKYCDAVFCHYPDALVEFRREGFRKPIYMQTQVGVDPDIFYPNISARNKIRKKYHIENEFLFGSASRFHYSKGLSEVIQALPSEGNWKYLMMGWGREDEVEKIKKEIKDRNLDDKIILTGYIDNWDDMAEHWNALDCAIHCPLTTEEWEETFSLALVQAMITGLPVIGSSSGSVPYQLGEDGVIVQEGDIVSLREQMIRMMNHPEEAKEYGKTLRDRAMNCFSIYSLNELFYKTIIDISMGVYDKNKIDMTKRG